MAGGATGECVLGLDIGTTGARAVAFDLAGRQLYAAAADYPLHAPHPGWAEQDAEQVCGAATACLREVADRARRERCHAAALGLSAILHSLIPVDAAGHALGPAIIWADGRSTAEADEIRAEVDALALYHRVGGPVHPMYSPPKLRWLRRHRPDVFAAAAAFVGIKEYVLRRWTGLHLCDRSIASGTGLYDLRAASWDGEALALAGLTAERLPPLVEPAAPLPVPAARRRALGLPDDCVVVAGAGDGVLQTIGTGCVAPGQMVAMVATSGAIRAVVDEVRTDPQARTWCYYLGAGRWVAGAAINNAGLVFVWLRDQLQAAARDVEARGKRQEARKRQTSGGNEAAEAIEIEVEDLNRWAGEVPAGSNGLLFLPYLAGERSPNWNANARGLLFGLSLAHDYRHLARATLEGVAYRMRTIFEPMEEVAGAATEIRAAGGFTRSPLWLQIVADVLGRPLVLADSPEASALGAAQLAMLGAGIAARFEDLAALARTGATVLPDHGRHALYGRLYERYQRIYDLVRNEFAAIAHLQAELAT
jgi:gluconokinase